MTPHPAPFRFGRTPAQSVRGAVLLALLGGAAVWGLGRLLFAPRSPFAPLLGGLGVPEWVIPAAGWTASGLLAVLGLAWSLTRATRFTIAREGLAIAGPLGAYLVTWENLAAWEAAPGGALGLRLRDRAALLATHTGAARQREWLRTQEPFGEWDLLFPAAELGVPAQVVVERLTAAAAMRRPDG